MEETQEEIKSSLEVCLDSASGFNDRTPEGGDMAGREGDRVGVLDLDLDLGLDEEGEMT